MKSVQEKAQKTPHRENGSHPELVGAAALSGIVAGAATGLVAGPPGAIAGGLVGAVVGLLAGASLEEAATDADQHDRALDAEIGVTSEDLGARDAAASALTTLNAQSGGDDAKQLRAELLAEHAELEVLVDTLCDAIAAGDVRALSEPWKQFEDGLAQHFAIEEAALFPAFAAHAPDEVDALQRAHDQIRTRVGDLSLAVELHTVRAAQFAELVAFLREHRMAEEKAFYRWAEGRPRVAT